MSDKSPKEICEGLLGQTITSIEIDTDDELIKITLSNGYLEFEGDGLEMYVDNNQLDS